MKTVIIGSGQIYNYDFCLDILKSADKIICADGGTRHAANMKITPDVIIGDMDSSEISCIDYFKKMGVKIVRYPKEKDKTDTHICVEFALTFSKEITLLGATGSRIDHTIANISLLKLGIDAKIPITVIDNKNRIRMIDDFIVLGGSKGDLFSLIPVMGKAEGISTKGAYYELTDATIEFGDSYGISNCFNDDKVEVSLKKGYLLVIKSED